MEYSFDYDDYLRDERIDESREQRRIDEMRRQDALDDFRRDAERDRAMESMREVINNDNIKIDNELQKIVNDSRMIMDQRGNIRRMDKSGRDVIRSSGQFSPIALSATKRTRRKTKMDKTMSKCLKMANKKLRKKNGQLRKGKTMADVMRMAHRLCKKE